MYVSMPKMMAFISDILSSMVHHTNTKVQVTSKTKVEMTTRTRMRREMMDP